MRDGMARHYDEFIPVLKRFGQPLPPELIGTPTHLDPDFDQLTYGDQGQRGKRIASFLTKGDLLAFFAGLRPIDGPARPLVYALIGLYAVEEIVPATAVPKSQWAENAHSLKAIEPERPIREADIRPIQFLVGNTINSEQNTRHTARLSGAVTIWPPGHPKGVELHKLQARRGGVALWNDLIAIPVFQSHQLRSGLKTACANKHCSRL